MVADAAPSRVERQLKKLNQNESDCLHSVRELLANTEEESSTEDVLKGWDDFHSQILQISKKAQRNLL